MKEKPNLPSLHVIANFPDVSRKKTAVKNNFPDSNLVII